MTALAHIDTLRFARSGEKVAGEIGVDRLARLTDILNPDDAAVQYQLSGAIRSGRPVLHLLIRATVWLTCQRCLERFPERLELSSALPIARDEAELARWEAEDPMLDALLADPRLEVSALLEDEILLGLPLAPRHPEGMCRAEGPA
jgi:uncharacterized protein